jgi:hypothetical protein
MRIKNASTNIRQLDEQISTNISFAQVVYILSTTFFQTNPKSRSNHNLHS